MSTDSYSPNSFLHLVHARQSCRAYFPKPVERDKLDRCLEAARLAPSSCNHQPWTFIVVDQPDLKKRIAKETFLKAVSMNYFTVDAPVLVLIVAEPTLGPSRLGSFLRRFPIHYMDIGIAAEHFCLQATQEGLGTCMLGWLRDRKIRKFVGVPRGKRIPLAIAVGYPAKVEARAKNRKSIDEVRSYNRYR